MKSAFRSILARLGAPAAALLLTLTLTGCHSSGGSGAFLGGAIGALAGNAIGHDTEATLIGTAIGAGVGYAVGNEIDKDRYHAGSYSDRGYGQTYDRRYNYRPRYRRGNDCRY